MEFLRSFLRRHFAGKPFVACRNVWLFSQGEKHGKVKKPLAFSRQLSGFFQVKLWFILNMFLIFSHIREQSTSFKDGKKWGLDAVFLYSWIPQSLALQSWLNRIGQTQAFACVKWYHWKRTGQRLSLPIRSANKMRILQSFIPRIKATNATKHMEHGDTHVVSDECSMCRAVNGRWNKPVRSAVTAGDNHLQLHESWKMRRQITKVK